MLFAAAGTLAAVRGLVRPRIPRAGLVVETVTRGSVEATFSASGIVEPLDEEVVSSAVASRVLEVIARPGDVVEAGQPLLRLDVSDLELELGRLRDEIRLKAGQADEQGLALEARLIELSTGARSAALELEVLEARVAQKERLRTEGLIPSDDAATARLERDKAMLRLEEIRLTRANAEKSSRVKRDGTALEGALLESKRGELEARLLRARLAAPRAGTVTWVGVERGASVREGEPLVRIADVATFRIRASASDVHAGRISVGQVARIRAADAALSGRVAQVMPAVTDGVLGFLVELDPEAVVAASSLRSQMRADVHVVTERRDGVLSLGRGPGIAAGAGGRAQLFVLEGSSAVRRSVELGICGVEACEVRAGLAEGDAVVASDVRSFTHLREVGLR